VKTENGDLHRVQTVRDPYNSRVQSAMKAFLVALSEMTMPQKNRVVSAHLFQLVFGPSKEWKCDFFPHSCTV
jgi:hypothetical protein